MIEVEVKFKMPVGIEEVKKIAGAHKFGAFTSPREYVDWYYDIGIGKLLRIRSQRIRGELLNSKLTFKGDKIAGKSREEIEVDVGNAVDYANIIRGAFALTPVLEVRKIQQHSFAMMWDAPSAEINDTDDRSVVLSIDHVDGLGDFVEIEVIAHREVVAPTLEAIEEWARKMFPGVEFINESYYEMMRAL